MWGRRSRAQSNEFPPSEAHLRGKGALGAVAAYWILRTAGAGRILQSGGRSSKTSRAGRRLRGNRRAPDYFLQEVVQDQQMNFQQLAAYIRDLQRTGIDTITLQVRFYRNSRCLCSRW